MEQLYLGIEFGSTRIKAITVDTQYRPTSSGDYTWASTLQNGIWSYLLPDVWTGLKTALSSINNREKIKAMGISGMMHG